MEGLNQVLFRIVEEENNGRWIIQKVPEEVMMLLSKRYLIAIRDLKEGELIFTESPAVWGPGQREDTCLVCLGSTRETRGEGEAPGVCDHCWWPVCSEACRQSPVHRLECRYLASCTATGSGESALWRGIALIKSDIYCRWQWGRLPSCQTYPGSKMPPS